MKRLLFEIHRWLGILTAVFMVLWFFTGLVIVYANPINQSRLQQRAHAELLAPEPGWLGLGEAWQRSAAQRKEQRETDKRDGARSRSDAAPSEARLARHAGVPVWLVDDGGRRLALSALDGSVHATEVDDALKIAAAWAGPSADVRLLETADHFATLRNTDALRPIHRVAIDDGRGRELLISARTGEVLQDSTRLDRAMYWAGNWLHVFRPLEMAGWETRRHDVLAWVSGIALAVTITGLIIGWLRWRPGWFGRPTYAEGRAQPYRAFWFRWHFWSGLLGGVAALLWIFSGFLNNNPGQMFSAPMASRDEIARYVGVGRPAAMFDWSPAALTGEQPADTVELSWHRLGDQTMLLAHDRVSRRWAPHGSPTHFDDAALGDAVRRLGGESAHASIALQREYDDYYYPRHNRDAGERPLPVVRAQLDDAAGTRLYIDPADGRLLLKQDDSRRSFRWLFSALHHWDFGWLYARPLWDLWMIVWCLFGLVMAVSAMVIGWRRLARTLRRSKPAVPARQLAAEDAGS